MINQPSSWWPQVTQSAAERPLISMLVFIFILGMLGVWSLLAADPSPIKSDMMSLVYETGSDTVREAALTRMRNLSNQQQLWIVSHPDRDIAFTAAESISGKLAASDLFYSNGLASGSLNQTALTEFYADHPFQLADDETLRAAEGKNFAPLISAVERALYSNARFFPASALQDDPFLLRNNFLAALRNIPPPFVFDRGRLAAKLDDRWTFLLPLHLKRSAFDFENQERLGIFTAAVTRDLKGTYPKVKVDTIGVIDFASVNRKLAIREVSLIGSVSLLMVTLLLFSAFRHPRAYLAVIFTIATALLGGCFASLISFGSVHLLTLIGGSTLVGISVDYAFHFLADRYRQGDGPWRALDTINHVTPTAAMGLATSVLGFFGLWSSGFRGLQEIAVFSASGLIVAFSTLVLAYPLLLAGWRPASNPPFVLRLAQSWRAHWSAGPRTLWLLAGASALLFLSAPPLVVSTDVRPLAADTPAINKLAAQSTTFTARLTDSRFIIVRAGDQERLLQREEELRIHLDALKEDGSITQFQQLARFVPSIRRQQATIDLNKSLYLAPGQAITELSERIGLDPRVADSQRTALRENPSPSSLSLTDWLKSPVSKPLRYLWLGEVEGGVASIVTLSGVHNANALHSRIDPLASVSVVDYIADMSGAFGLYVLNAVKGLAIALALVAALMVYRFGLAAGIITLLGPVLSGLLTITWLLFLGEAINLFHIVGLAIILGMGMDYTLFLKAGGCAPSAALAVLLGAITTECAFGLLGLSALGGLSSFGTTVAIGTAISFLVAPLAAGPAHTASVH